MLNSRCRSHRDPRGTRFQRQPMDRRSFPTWHQHALVESGIINGLADSAKRVKPVLAALALIEEGIEPRFRRTDSYLGLAGSQFVLDPFFDFRGQVHIHGRPRFLILRQHRQDRPGGLSLAGETAYPTKAISPSVKGRVLEDPRRPGGLPHTPQQGIQNVLNALL